MVAGTTLLRIIAGTLAALSPGEAEVSTVLWPIPATGTVFNKTTRAMAMPRAGAPQGQFKMSVVAVVEMRTIRPPTVPHLL